jgi:hypothetical protein
MVRRHWIRILETLLHRRVGTSRAGQASGLQRRSQFVEVLSQLQAPQAGTGWVAGQSAKSLLGSAQIARPERLRELLKLHALLLARTLQDVGLIQCAARRNRGYGHLVNSSDCVRTLSSIASLLPVSLRRRSDFSLLILLALSANPCAIRFPLLETRRQVLPPAWSLAGKMCLKQRRWIPGRDLDGRPQRAPDQQSVVGRHGQPPGVGALFGLTDVAGQGVYFVDDDENALNLFH